jgi:hypothetical protein
MWLHIRCLFAGTRDDAASGGSREVIINFAFPSLTYSEPRSPVGAGKIGDEG